MTIGRADILAAIRRATPATPPTDHKPCCACCSEVDRLAAEVERRLQHEREYQWGQAEMNEDHLLAAERARIAEAIRALYVGPNPGRSREPDLSEVLAIVEGEA